MNENLNNLDLATCSEAELKAFVRAVSPIVIKFLQGTQRLFADDQEQSPCITCDKRNTCDKACELLEKQLPGAFEGDAVLSNTFEDLDEFYTENSEESLSESKNNKYKPVSIPVPEEMFEAYYSCWHIFTQKQQSAIYHKYKQGLTNNEICKITGSKPSSVSDLLKRAEKKLKDHYSKKVKRNYT